MGRVQGVFDRDGGAILDIEAGTISTLNPTGAFVWERLQQHRDATEIIAALAQETGEDTATIGPDVREFIEELKLKHLLPE
jgi:hypothetical protein